MDILFQELEFSKLLDFIKKLLGLENWAGGMCSSGIALKWEISDEEKQSFCSQAAEEIDSQIWAS